MMRKTTSLTVFALMQAALLQTICVSADIKFAYCPNVVLEATRDQALFIVAANQAYRDVYDSQGDFRLVSLPYPAQDIEALGGSERRRLEEEEKEKEEIEIVHKQLMMKRNETNNEIALDERRNLWSSLCQDESYICERCLRGDDLTYMCPTTVCQFSPCRDGRNLRSKSRKLITPPERELFENRLQTRVNSKPFKDQRIMDCEFEIQ